MSLISGGKIELYFFWPELPSPAAIRAAAKAICRVGPSQVKK
jgi:hypothetical protein